MINIIYLKNLRNNEFIQFIENIQEIVLSNNPETLKVQDQYNALSEPLKILQQIHSNHNGSSITNELINIDKRRDVVLGSIFNIVDAYTHHFNTEVATKAIDLKKELDVYGREVIRYSYQYETNAIDDILAKWELKAEGIATLNLTEWVGELKEANTLFNTRFLDRVKESAEDSHIKVVEMRNVTTEKYNKLLGHLTSHATIEESEAYTKVIDQINALIDQYNRTLTARLSKKSSNQETEETENPEIINITTEEN